MSNYGDDDEDSGQDRDAPLPEPQGVGGLATAKELAEGYAPDVIKTLVRIALRGGGRNSMAQVSAARELLRLATGEGEGAGAGKEGSGRTYRVDRDQVAALAATVRERLTGRRGEA
jgi:hypothetical protein